MKFFKIVLRVLLALWQLPQTLAALVLLAYLWIRFRDFIIYGKVGFYLFPTVLLAECFPSSFSLGEFIFMHGKYGFETVLFHEYGHSLQSRMLGPLYLLVVGVPSVINYWRSTKSEKVRKNYYNMYPEKWADKLGGVER